ncbi:PilZ domain-containing protein [Hyalangium sp.]|uniref:PilZ domain-containing protein n=1 Tax=Hyalangium sp. TaxID=2028555 RepID=UPI002D34762D|nr:PilZ domain-containing protein [Hyalangium sp.]HYH98006.1 PilZ domain-containing protein [Hyalangium sp.]
MLPVYTSDVSHQGFQAEMLQPVKPGTALQGTLTLEGAEFPFEGEVVWMRQHAGERARGCYGVRFTSLPADFARRLVAYRRRQGRRLLRWFR